VVVEPFAAVCWQGSPPRRSVGRPRCWASFSLASLGTE